MSWETRNGKSYYYRKMRRNGKVVSVYRGKGAAGNLAERADLIAAGNREKARLEWEGDGEQIQQLERVADELEFVIVSLTRACLLAAGYRTHKGQWRLKRVKETSPGDQSAGTVERGEGAAVGRIVGSDGHGRPAAGGG